MANEGSRDPPPNKLHATFCVTQWMLTGIEKKKKKKDWKKMSKIHSRLLNAQFVSPKMPAHISLNAKGVLTVW